MDLYLFYIISFLTIASALYFVFAKNPLYNILSLVVTFFSIASLYILLNAQFLAIVQIIVYAGAIMVLFLYVIMMLNLSEKSVSKRSNLMKVVGIFSSGLLLVGFLGLYKGIKQNNITPEKLDNQIGLTKNLGKLLFNEYVLPFELASILILAGIVGSVLIGKKDL